MGVVYILWIRHLKRYFRARARIVGSLGQPLLFLLALGFGFGPVFQQAGQGNYLEFLTPGVVAMGIIFTALFSGIEVIWDKQFGFLKETLVAPVSRLNIMIGWTLGGATVAVFQGIIILALSMMIGFKATNLALFPLVFIFMFLIALIFTGVGIAIASVLEDMQGFQLIMNFLVIPLFFLSGAIFPIGNLPKALQFAVSINPLSYGVDGIRAILVGETYFGVLVDLVVLVILTGMVLSIGSYLFSKIQV